ncbi:TetR/AcrR family transcriptional regulator [Acidicapsa ligni]|uniref:TetR/AcrR family transcriptional regulator n=1 Tax=Acidicapsa ligni TaxID=542300 RepID=UPI0021DF6B78|nr:TetR/AcrR family transcriptional regulator [Acidicapsa ligni]
MTKGEITRNRIISEAAPLFNKHGFDGCSMQEISVATGLEKASLYGHFATKEELAGEAFRYAWKQSCSARMGNLGDVANSVDKLKLHIENLASKQAFPGGCPLWNTATDTDDGNSVLRSMAKEALRDWISALNQIIEEGQSKGEIGADVDPEGLSTLIISLMEGAFITSQLQESGRVLRVAQQHLNAYIESQVRTRPQANETL